MAHLTTNRGAHIGMGCHEMLLEEALQWLTVHLHWTESATMPDCASPARQGMLQ
ncbi:hypothetical protein DUNSADRAFT_5460 [Dunaliella salina]|uniref:Uncharacterized protein n=1 Tax=Dunaliella salina TaxID=3046 RepID=A0ABQ7GQ81_DUNSA|nr:hypothetical protein DUNSADRAFT_5460 [Dunaliella salina]|eukprot:KAF5836770.1 hypothetical protein DUNSADRAFT_5460 [Dunaliella salina]